MIEPLSPYALFKIVTHTTITQLCLHYISLKRNPIAKQKAALTVTA